MHVITDYKNVLVYHNIVVNCAELRYRSTILLWSVTNNFKSSRTTYGVLVTVLLHFFFKPSAACRQSSFLLQDASLSKLVPSYVRTTQTISWSPLWLSGFMDHESHICDAQNYLIVECHRLPHWHGHNYPLKTHRWISLTLLASSLPTNMVGTISHSGTFR